MQIMGEDWKYVCERGHEWWYVGIGAIVNLYNTLEESPSTPHAPLHNAPPPLTDRCGGHWVLLVITIP